MPAPIDLFFWPTPNGWKITIALEEMALPYRVTLVNIGAGDQFKPEFLAISPNNRMPAILDPEGPDGAPVSVFESGAILLYLARKTGLFYGRSERDRIAVEEWLMWQMGGVGPMAGQAHHFLKYAPAMDPPNDLPYAKGRYRKEDVLAVLTSVFERAGAEVAPSSSPAEILEVLAEDPGAFDLLVTDFDMPEMTGADLARAAHALRPDLPVMMVTALPDWRGRDMPGTTDPRFATVVAKPASASALVAGVLAALPSGAIPDGA